MVYKYIHMYIQTLLNEVMQFQVVKEKLRDNARNNTRVSV